MSTRPRSDVLKQRVLAGVFAVGVSMLLLGYAVAGPVVESITGQEATHDPTTGESTGAPGYPWATAPLPETKQTQATPQTTTTLPPSTGQAPPTTGQAPPTGTQQPLPPIQGTPQQAMPLPPTYAPGAPGAVAGGDVNPYGAMPQAPTAFGLYDSPTPSGPFMGPGMASPGAGMGMGGGRMMTAPSRQPATGYGGYGAPPSPTPSLGWAAMNDPSFGRFEHQSVQQATAPRQPANIGQSASQVLRGDKPFSSYRPASAYSPYMRLDRDLTSTNPATNSYYEWVKPLLEQQQENRQVTHSIQGLADTARMGHQSLESMKQRPGATIQGTAPRTPATFMNTGQYFGGGARR